MRTSFKEKKTLLVPASYASDDKKKKREVKKKEKEAKEIEKQKDKEQKELEKQQQKDKVLKDHKDLEKLKDTRNRRLKEKSKSFSLYPLVLPSSVPISGGSNSPRNKKHNPKAPQTSKGISSYFSDNGCGPAAQKFLLACFHWIEDKSERLQEKGLYRVNGSASGIEKLKQMVIREPTNFQIGADESLHDVTGVVKLFLREMQEPLIPYDLYNGFIASFAGDTSEKEKLLGQVISFLPQHNKEMLHSLMVHLHKVAQFSAQNMMTTSNLAIIFTPNLLRSRVETPEVIIADAKFATAVVMNMINNFEMYFGTKPPSPCFGDDNIPRNETSHLKFTHPIHESNLRACRSADDIPSISPNKDKRKSYTLLHSDPPKIHPVHATIREESPCSLVPPCPRSSNSASSPLRTSLSVGSIPPSYGPPSYNPSSTCDSSLSARDGLSDSNQSDRPRLAGSLAKIRRESLPPPGAFIAVGARPLPPAPEPAPLRASRSAGFIAETTSNPRVLTEMKLNSMECSAKQVPVLEKSRSGTSPFRNSKKVVFTSQEPPRRKVELTTHVRRKTASSPLRLSDTATGKNTESENSNQNSDQENISHKRPDSENTRRSYVPPQQALKMLTDRYNEHLKVSLQNYKELSEKNELNPGKVLADFFSSYKEGYLGDKEFSTKTFVERNEQKDEIC